MCAHIKKISSPHDKIFEDFFEEKETALSFLQENLPEKIKKELDFDTLKISKDSFIDKKLARYFSDILYEIKLKNRPVFIYLLFEHKSREEWFIAFQLLKYMVKIWEKHFKQNKTTRYLPAIIPIVIYHGKPKWKISENFIALFEEPGVFKRYIPDFSFDLYDISQLPDEEIKGTVLLKILFTTLKYISDPDLKNKLRDIFRLFGFLENKTKATEYLEALLRYLASSAEAITEEDLRDSISQALENGGDIMPTLAEQWMEQGIEKGLEQGIEQGIEKGIEKNKWDVVRNGLAMGLPIETVSKLTGLPIEKIKLMKSKMELEKSRET